MLRNLIVPAHRQRYHGTFLVHGSIDQASLNCHLMIIGSNVHDTNLFLRVAADSSVWRLFSFLQRNCVFPSSQSLQRFPQNDTIDSFRLQLDSFTTQVKTQPKNSANRLPLQKNQEFLFQYYSCVLVPGNLCEQCSCFFSYTPVQKGPQSFLSHHVTVLQLLF